MLYMAREEPLARLARRHEVVAVTVDDPREVHLPDAGWVEFEDAENGRRVLLDAGHAPTRLEVRVAAERFLLERGRKLNAAGVDRVTLRTDAPYAVALRQAFAARARRLRR